MTEFSTPPGWYPDGEGWERRWDGSAWTDERRRTAPAAPPPPPSAPSGPPPAAPTMVQPGGGVPPTSAPQGQSPAGPPPGGYPPQGYPQQQGFPPGPQGGPQGFGGFPSGPAKKKKPVALFVALGVVLLLILGTGITLAALHPWSKDDNGGGGGDDGDDDTASKTVVGDLDGDGLGDVRAVINDDFDSYRQITGKSDGKRFALSSLAVSESSGESQTAFIDFNDDGKLDPVTYQYDTEAKDLSLQSTTEGFQITSAIPMDFATLDTLGEPRVEVQAGDFDGDGKGDLVVFGQHNRTIDAYVMIGHGDGSFDDPAKWISIPNAVIREANMQVGDFDGDGKTDMWGVVSTRKLTTKDYKEGFLVDDLGTSIFKSTGQAFAPPHVVPVSRDTDLYLVDDAVSGNVTGGDHDSVVSLAASSNDRRLTVTAYNVSTGGLVPEPGLSMVDTTLGNRDLSGAVLSDVDGDGDGDIVYLAKNYDQNRFYGFRVILADGKKFDRSQPWGDVPPCKGDYCTLESMD